MSDNAKFRAAIKEAKKVLESTRNPTLLGEVPHSYQDKFTTAERLGSTVLNTVRHVLHTLGLKDSQLETIHEWIAANHNVSLAYKYTSNCKFKRKASRVQKSDTATVTESTTQTVKRFTETRITEYFWSITHEYVVRIHFGSNADDAAHGIVLLQQKGSSEVITRVEEAPGTTYPGSTRNSVIITNLFKTEFEIDRSNVTCRTPRRNSEIDQLLLSIAELSAWFTSLASTLRSTGTQFASSNFPTRVSDRKNTPLMTNAEKLGQELVIPILPIADQSVDESADTVLLEPNVQQKLFDNFCNSMSQTLSNLQVVSETTTDRKGQTVFGFVESKILFFSSLVQQVHDSFTISIDYLENQLRRQVLDAIGKHVDSSDMAEYITFHYRKLFRKQFAPKPFSHEVRRPGSTPEGLVSLQYFNKEINTFSLARDVDLETMEPPTIRVALSSSTDAVVQGTQIAHGMVMHKFQSDSEGQLQMIAQARQFSSFVLMLGRIVDTDRFDPEHAVIVQNKDLLEIPIHLKVIPTAKEFRKAIASLSPEQQQFASAFRRMQLQATLFGILVLPIRPNMERLLKLPARSLIKEIKLTQQLMKHFIEFQIPSDLLAWDGDDEEEDLAKVNAVRKYSEAVCDMIDDSRKKQLQDKKQEAQFRRAARSSSSDSSDESEFEEEEECDVGGGGIFFGDDTDEDDECEEYEDVKEVVDKEVMDDEVESPDPSLNQKPDQNDVEQQQQSDTSEYSATPSFVDIPKIVEHAFDSLDTDSKLRPTTLHPSDSWLRTSREGILGAPQRRTFDSTERTSAKREALDLLDALSRSGELPLTGATLHVVVATTQCFDETVMDTLVKGNVNPIEPIERSSLILASVIQQQNARAILNQSEVQRVANHSPMLFPALQ